MMELYVLVPLEIIAMTFPEPKYQNSAGRLLALLTAPPSGQTFAEVFPKTFGLPMASQDEKVRSCFTALGEIETVYLEFKRDLVDATTNEQQRNVLLSGLATVPQCFYPMQLNATYRGLTEAEKSLLEVCATMISQEEPLRPDDIKTIRESLADLRKFLEQSDIASTLRKVLLDLIRLSEDAISRFNVYGARGLRRTFKTMLGEAAEFYGNMQQSSEAERGKSAEGWKKITHHLKVFDSVASKLLKYQPLFESTVQLFIGSGHAK